MRVAAELTVESSSREERRAERFAAGLEAGIREQGRASMPVWLVNISTHGCRVQCRGAVPVGSLIWLKLPGLESWQGRVAWSEPDGLGCEFERPLHPAVLQRVLKPAPRARG